MRDNLGLLPYEQEYMRLLKRLDRRRFWRHVGDVLPLAFLLFALAWLLVEATR